MSAIPAISSTTSASSIRNDYLKLLAAQLSNQNPMEPMDNHDMTLQMAALAELEQMENVNSSFSTLLQNFGMVQAGELIGKEVTFFPIGGDGMPSTESVSGVVTEAKLVDGDAKVVVNAHTVSLGEIVAIKEVTQPT
ncbi:MAG: hypothetical protein K8S55_04385 [Phycisphaerae bacterium]|nr:hypothetical protein [Phycisphaerae bacterium]